MPNSCRIVLIYMYISITVYRSNMFTFIHDYYMYVLYIVYMYMYIPCTLHTCIVYMYMYIFMPCIVLYTFKLSYVQYYLHHSYDNSGLSCTISNTLEVTLYFGRSQKLGYPYVQRILKRILKRLPLNI